MSQPASADQSMAPEEVLAMLSLTQACMDCSQGHLGGYSKPAS